MKTKTEFNLPLFGRNHIHVTLSDGKGRVVSDLREDDSRPPVPEDPSAEAWNRCIDVIESMILSHATAGIDVSEPAYLQGVESTLLSLSRTLPPSDAERPDLHEQIEDLGGYLWNVIDSVREACPEIDEDPSTPHLAALRDRLEWAESILESRGLERFAEEADV